MKEQHKKESPVLSLLGMGGGGTGTALGGLTLPKTYVDDVFGTYLYRGNDTARSINNGIDLAGEGGLVWIKQRIGSNRSHILTDTARGASKHLVSNTAAAQVTSNNVVSAFNSNGFNLGTTYDVNQSPTTFASWSFRKAPGFFDVVTYTGNDTAGRTVAHSLGSVPGMILIKCVGAQEDWHVYHRSLGATKNLRLNETDVVRTETNKFNDTEPTSSVFTLGSNNNVNGSGRTFVAYVFAHDDAQFGTGGNESIIKCGSYTGNGSTNGPEIDLGFEPQFLFLKCSSRGSSNQYGGSGMMLDVVRGIPTGSSGLACVAADESNDEATDNNIKLNVTSTGFKLTSGGAYGNENGGTYTYMAIRRPNKPPELATEVFNPILADTPRTAAQRPEKVDMYWFGKTGGWAENIQVSDRLRGFQNTNSGGDDSHTSPWLITNDVNQEAASGGAIAQENNASIGPLVVGVSAGSNFINYIFKRAPGFFDIVAYTGTGSNISIPHNLGTIPELVIVKHRNASDQWIIFTSKIDGSTDYFYFSTSSKGDSSQSMPSASAINWTGSSSVINTSAGTYIAYLFATLPGISKVGTYTGTGNAINVPCGFTNGARFVLIKRTDGTGGWYLWDTARGIVSGNDPYILLNTTAAQVTNTDYVDPLTSGFTVTSSAPANLNASGGTYIFLAIA
jgi:hypothetical protein